MLTLLLMLTLLPLLTLLLLLTLTLVSLRSYSHSYPCFLLLVLTFPPTFALPHSHSEHHPGGPLKRRYSPVQHQTQM